MQKQTHHTLLEIFDELRSEKVLVRGFREGDADAQYEAIVESRERLRPWLPWVDHYASVEDSQDFVIRSRARWLLREDFAVGLFDVTSGRFLGGSGLHPRNWDVGFFEIGYWIRTSAEGNGYVTDAVKLLTDFAIERLNARRVMIRCDVRNTRSAAVAERLGFVREGLLRNDQLDTTGHVRSTLIFSRTPDDPRWPR